MKERAEKVVVLDRVVYTQSMEIKSVRFIKGIRGTDLVLYDGVRQVAFIGRSNVGKSSLINALCNKGIIAKTGKKPGKTKEINIFDINGGECYFIDLPGYGYAKVSPGEKEMLKKLIYWYLAESSVKPLVVLVLDTKVGVTAYDKETIQLLIDSEHNFIIAANKSDKLTQKEFLIQLRKIQSDAKDIVIIPCTTTKKNGVSALKEKIFETSHDMK